MTTNMSHLKYRPDIDGLRAVAVLSVVIYHAFPSYLQGGFAGVDVFFVISGFLISTILFQNLDKETFSIFDFYSRRIRRIFPALALVLLSVLIFGWFCLFPDELQQLGKHTAGSAGFLQNFTLWKEAGYFDNTSETKPLLHIWSLGIEEQFYFVWPLLLWWAGKLGGTRHKRALYLLATFLILITSFILNLNLVKIDPTKTFYLPQYRFWELAIGGSLSWLVLYRPTFSISFPDSQGNLSTGHSIKWMKDSLAFLGFAILLVVFIKFNKDTIFPGKKALLPVFATAFIIFAGQDALLNRKVLSHKILVWFGLISFPLYLWHWPILSFGRIIYGEMPPREFRILAVLVSILLAWLTVKIIEKPFRFGNQKNGLKVAVLCCIVFLLAGLGFGVKNSDGHLGRENVKIRLNTKDTIGLSDRWYKGKSDWLFLGNAYDRTVSKLKLTITPPESEINATRDVLSNLADTASKYDTKVVLIVGPNKSSIYPEYLPDEVTPSAQKYSHFFLDRLKDLQNLTVYNPANDLLTSKETEGLLYWMTDTHWNNKGAFVAYRGFSKLFDLPVPQVNFKQGATHPGDLFGFAGIKDFPLYSVDNWDVTWKTKAVLTEKEIPDEQESSFSKPKIVSNRNPLSNKKIWVVGDSFTTALKQYFNATFKEVYYVGHWGHKLNDLSKTLSKANAKPDIIVIVRVERSF